MKIGKYLLLTCGLLLGIAGCASTGNINKDYRLNESSGKGVLIVSLTRSGSYINTTTLFNVRGISNKYSNSINILPTDWHCPSKEKILWAEPCGRLVIIELSNGLYEFYSFRGSSESIANMEIRNVFSAIFSVKAGKAVYAGNLNINYKDRKTSGSVEIQIKNRKGRDLPLLAKKNPNIKLKDIVIKLME